MYVLDVCCNVDSLTGWLPVLDLLTECTHIWICMHVCPPHTYAQTCVFVILVCACHDAHTHTHTYACSPACLHVRLSRAHTQTYIIMCDMYVCLMCVWCTCVSIDQQCTYVHVCMPHVHVCRYTHVYTYIVHTSGTHTYISHIIIYVCIDWPTMYACACVYAACACL